ncbi:MAG: efflux RND transporter permease subunit [Acidobacteriales bacterium]|nr:efflux RND transporter permease subunit [Terriglobales bacterium]
MSFSTPFIERPIGTMLLTVALLLAGALAYFQLPVGPLPRVDFPVINVGAGLPGASPETMASSVATPLERQFGHIAAVNQMTSSSSLGSTNITLQFDLSRDINAAARDVQAAINAARGQLPSYLPQNPGYRKVNPADAPIMILGITSDTMTQPQMYDMADSILAQKISQIEGIGQVFIWGSAQPAVRIEANPLQLNSFGIGLDSIRTAVQAQNVSAPKGEIQGPSERYTLTANDQLQTADQYSPLVIASRNAGSVRLGTVANVVDAQADIRNAGEMDGKPSVNVVLFRQPGANIIATVDRVYAALPVLQASIPPAAHLQVSLDRTTTIRASVRDVEFTLLASVALVVLVVFVFLRNVRATIIPSVAVPLAIVGTFGVMYLFGYSIDNLSLMALTVSTGFVVDDAIVVIENIMRHIEDGMRPYEAALLGAREIGFTIVSISVSLIAVFIPILLMGGIVGRLFREFAMVVSSAILISMVVSLTTTPMLCAHFLVPPKSGRRNWLFRFSERGFELINRGYEHALAWVLRNKFIGLLGTLAIIGGTVYMYVEVPKGFFPQQDTGRLSGGMQAEQDIAFDALRAKLFEFARIVRQDPAVAHVVDSTQGSNSGRMFVILKPLNERVPKNISSDQVIARLRPKLSHVAGANLFLQTSQELQVGGRQANAQYQYTLQSESLDALNTWAPLLLERLRKEPILTEVNTDQQNHGLQQVVVIDRATASRLGVTAQQIDAALYDAFGQEQISTIYKQLNQYHVVLEVAPEFQRSPDSLKAVYVRSSNGNQVPLSAFVHFEEKNTSLSVNHQGTFPASTISFNLAPGVSLGQATAAIEAAKRDIRMPGTITGSFQGTAAVFQQSLQNEPYLILAAVFAVYIVLGVLYESYIHPITILSTLPSAGLGALLALQITQTDLSVIALIGIILLIGIVKKNAIMMIDFALVQEREHGKTSEESIFAAALMRFRPITMTTMSALFGAMPLAFGTGVGSELRHPLGISIVGGLIVSQMITLFTTPVIYIYLDRVQMRLQRTFRRRAPQPGTPAVEAV